MSGSFCAWPVPGVLSLSRDMVIAGPDRPIVMIGVLVAAVVAVGAIVWEVKLVRRRGGRPRRFVLSVLTLGAAGLLALVCVDASCRLLEHGLYDPAKFPTEPVTPTHAGGDDTNVIYTFTERTEDFSIYGYWRAVGFAATLKAYNAPGADGAAATGVFREYPNLEVTHADHAWDTTIKVPQNASDSSRVTWNASVTVPKTPELGGRHADLVVSGTVRYPRAVDAHNFVEEQKRVTASRGIDFADAGTVQGWQVADAKYKADDDAYWVAHRVVYGRLMRNVMLLRGAAVGLALVCVAGIYRLLSRAGRAVV